MGESCSCTSCRKCAKVCPVGAIYIEGEPIEHTKNKDIAEFITCKEEPQMTATAKVRVATVWLSGCSGCHMSFLDQDERLIDLAKKIQLVYSPIADIKEFPENVDVTLIEGALANEDQLAMLKKARAEQQNPDFTGRLRSNRKRHRTAKCLAPQRPSHP